MIRPSDWYAQHPPCPAHPVQVAVHHAGRDPVAGARNRREFGDFLAVRPDAAAAVAGAAIPTSWSISRRRDRSRDRIPAIRPAAATRFSATRCSRISSGCRPASPALPRIATFGGSIGYQGTSLGGEGLLVSGSYFPVLGLTPALGRLFTPEDDKTVGSHFVVVLSHRLLAQPVRAESGDPQRDARHQRPGDDRRRRRAARIPRHRRSAQVPDMFVPMTMRGLMEPGFNGFENRRQYWAYLFGAPEAGRVDANRRRSRSTVRSKRSSTTSKRRCRRA